MNKIDYQALREAAQLATWGEWVVFISSDTGTYAVHTPGDKRREDVIKWTGFDGQDNVENNARYITAFNPGVVQVLLDEQERSQQYTKRRDQENEDTALTVRKLRVELEETKSKLNKRREYYEDVVSDRGKRITGLEEQCAKWERKILSNCEECAVIAERVEEMQIRFAPDSFGIIGKNIRT